MAERGITYRTAPLTLARHLSEQPWDCISADDSSDVLVLATSDLDILIDRCAAILLSRIVCVVKNRKDVSTEAVVGNSARVTPSLELQKQRQNFGKSWRMANNSFSSIKSDADESFEIRGRMSRGKKPVRIQRRFTFTKFLRGSTVRLGSRHYSNGTNVQHAMLDESSCGEDVSVYESECREQSKLPPSVTAAVRMQVREYVSRIASRYQHVPYHTFEHATHVLLSANKLLFLLVSAGDEYEDPIKKRAFGLNSNFEYQLALIFAALVHDVDHGGVSNQTLINECDPLSILYNDQSVLEQRSLAVAFTELMDPRFEELRSLMFPSQKEFMEFRNIVIDLVLTTDIASGERMQIVKSKWKEAFDAPNDLSADRESSSRKIDCKPPPKTSATYRQSLNRLPSIIEPSHGNDNEVLEENDIGRSAELSEISEESKTTMNRRLSISPANSVTSDEEEEEEESSVSFSLDLSGLSSSLSERRDSLSDRNQFASRSMTELRGPKSLPFDDKRSSLPASVAARSNSMRQSSSYRLGIKRAMSLSGDVIEVYASSKDDKLKAIVVMEWIMKAADVSSLMQSFPNFMKWSSRLFDELYVAYKAGRGPDPSGGWCDNQVVFFDSYISQLAERLEETTVFGSFGSHFIQQVHRNREKWLEEGSKLTYELIEGAKERTKSFESVKRNNLRQLVK